MENKTAVEQLENDFEKFIAWMIEGDHKAVEFTTNDMYKAFQQALELETAQHGRTWDAAIEKLQTGDEYIEVWASFDKYYSETYKNKSDGKDRG